MEEVLEFGITFNEIKELIYMWIRFLDTPLNIFGYDVSYWQLGIFIVACNIGMWFVYHIFTE